MDRLIPLRSEEGRARLAQAAAVAPGVVSSWRQQIGRRCCGVTSLAICGSSLHLTALTAELEGECDGLTAGGGGPTAMKVTEAAVLHTLEQADGRCDAPSPATVHAAGLTLEEVARAAQVMPWVVGAARYHCGGDVPIATSASSLAHTLPDLDALRAALQSALAPSLDGAPQTRVILNYDMDTLGQKGFRGHLSPVAAFHLDTDSFLIADTWPSTEPVWASTALIWTAAATRDTTSNAPRGLLVIEVQEQPVCE